MSKIVVVIRSEEKMPNFAVQNEVKEYSNAYAINNEKGQLVINRSYPAKPEFEKAYGKYDTMRVIAVFNEWVYYEVIEDTDA